MPDNSPRKYGLFEFLSSNNQIQYIIPIYQRKYTWTAKKEVKQFLDDIKDVIKGTYSNHFMGILIHLNKISGYSIESFIIDGQQRLTTTFLMAFAIRDLLDEGKNRKDAKSFESFYLKLNNGEPRLKPEVSDDLDYNLLTQKKFEKLKDSDSNIYLNYLYIKDELSKLVEKGYTLEEIQTVLREKIHIVCIPLETDDNPQKIFESINSTGAKLTAADLIRNFILMNLTSKDQERFYQDYWIEIEENFDKDSKQLEEFFRFYLAVKNKTLISKTNVYGEFKTWFIDKNQELTSTEVENMLNDILYYSNIYKKIYIDDIKVVKTKPLTSALIDFRRIDSAMPAPFLMEMYSLYDKKNITESNLTNIVKMITIYLLRRNLCSMETNSISRTFTGLLNSVLNACDNGYSDIEVYVKRYLVNATRGKSSVMPDDSLLKEHLLKDDMYILRNTLKFVLEKLESVDNNATIRFDIVSIEHIMPQTPTKEWLKLSGAKNNEEYLDFLHRLGNLTFLSQSDNSKAGNNIWDFKKELFKTTDHIRLNQEIMKIPTWNITEIKKRSNFLADKIIKLFPYFIAPEEKLDIIPIHINTGTRDNTIKANFNCDTGAVEIVKDSYFIVEPKYVNDFYDKLEEDGLVQKKGKKIIFTDNTQIYPEAKGTALSRAANLILNYSVNGKEVWLDSTNNPIKLNSNFKKCKFGKLKDK